MSLLGTAAVAMWWDIHPAQLKEFGDWHSHEHFPERMSIPGFRRGSRWRGGGNTFFVLYELDGYDTLTSDGYLARLNAPTPWSQTMMPHHLNMTRSQCRIVDSFGGGVAAYMATVRLSPANGNETGLRQALVDTLSSLPTQPGLTGAHLLRTDTPEAAIQTTEQRIRGGDKAADWIVLVSGYDQLAVADVVAARLSASKLREIGASRNVTAGEYALAFTMTPGDVGG